MIKPDIGIVVGRFQVHELHEGHLELFRIVKSRHNRVAVFLGCTKTGPNRKNPLDYETREKMIHDDFPDFTVHALQDKKTDEEWSRELDARIDDIIGGGPASVTLYGSRDSFAPHYHGKHKVKELDIEVPPSLNGTDIRARLTSQIKKSADFRAGNIYNAGLGYPHCIPTVDVAIHHDKHILVGRKPGEPGWRFIGGHAEVTTDSYEEDAKKEAMEESGLPISNVTYIGSKRIDDWRHRGTENGIKTAFFLAESMTFGGTGADDIEEVHWLPLDEMKPEDFEPEHQPLVVMLTTYLINATKREEAYTGVDKKLRLMFRKLGTEGNLTGKELDAFIESGVKKFCQSAFERRG
jgi:bifunctional NMN adenylyltransferase/nudix hydrolase